FRSPSARLSASSRRARRPSRRAGSAGFFGAPGLLIPTDAVAIAPPSGKGENSRSVPGHREVARGEVRVAAEVQEADSLLSGRGIVVNDTPPGIGRIRGVLQDADVVAVEGRGGAVQRVGVVGDGRT